jgi:glycosyltransferase involved in cell wall biosynthesis
LQDEILRFQERLATSRGSDLVAIFSGTQLREDEGQRPTQLALELVRREIPVVFVYWRWSNSELCAQDRLDDGILQLPTDLVTTRPDGFSRLFAGRRRIALFEFPHPSFFHLNAALNSAGWLTVYDVLDDWKEFHRVGQAVWYDEDFERHLITSSDAVFAVNGLLAERIRGLGGAWVEVVPNGFRPGIERADRPWPLTRGEITVGYFGYLAAAWFDWKLVGEAARREPSWRFYLVGYGQPGIESLPENVVLLGKQPQSRLAALAANWDVAIIPFKAERLAAGADPVKTYEYLAMGLPVVSTGVYPPRGAESFVTRADGVEDFLETIRRCAVDGSAVEVQRRRNHALSCTWSTRVSTVLESLQAKRQRVGQKLHLFGSSPALDAHAISAVEPTR